ncbi:hypothetical protein IST455A_05831 [Burkholderia multivorans]|uniref:Uncharacterized protein n=1 Tax=Burkholderia multivorans TaxID=87883 RepID=A0AAP2HK22_9BURK|nr:MULTISPECIES: hypothetical protein [Burkholderia]MBG0863102.1 hypothetical protein [Burkholderia sp. 9779_493]MBU9297545.1 hypothetical protein [Burkholderia multivorans]MBU9357520.1 hypothetical protein [Burkholderia multivorans]MBU9366574.1 hypothetical protein [Burkholderia multivorans]MBU9403495.1 hypothetical protein [Burkholderia multivorans]
MASENTLYVAFNPDPKNGWSYSFTGTDLTGRTQVYTLYSWYNHYSNRYYLRAVSANQTMALPLIESPDDMDIPLNAGYLATPIIYRASSMVLEIG